MFDDLTGRLGGIFDKLTRRGALKAARREGRYAVCGRVPGLLQASQREGGPALAGR